VAKPCHNIYKHLDIMVTFCAIGDDDYRHYTGSDHDTLNSEYKAVHAFMENLSPKTMRFTGKIITLNYNQQVKN